MKVLKVVITSKAVLFMRVREENKATENIKYLL